MLGVGVLGNCIKNAVSEDQRSQENYIRLAAEKGFEGIELWDWGNTAEELDRSESLLALAESVGIEVFGLGSAMRPGRSDVPRTETTGQDGGQGGGCADLAGQVPVASAPRASRHSPYAGIEQHRLSPCLGIPTYSGHQLLEKPQRIVSLGRKA